MERHGLPPLLDVLNGLSVSPVDLDSFYAFMRQNYSGVQYLTFWVESTRHLALCREFVNSNLNSEANARSRYKSGTSDGRHSPSSSMLFDVLQHGVADSEEERRRTHSTWRDTRSSYRFGDARHSDVRWSMGEGNGTNGNGGNLPQPAQRYRDSQIEEFQAHRMDTPTRVSMYLNQNPHEEVDLQHLAEDRSYYDARDSHPLQQQQQGHMAGNGVHGGVHVAGVAGMTSAGAPGAPGTTTLQTNRRKHSSVESPPLLGHSREGSRTVTRKDIYDNVDKLVEKYLTPSSSNAIVLPGEMAAQIRVAAQGRGKDDPELFESAREYVYSALERESYPAFLNQRALSNVQLDISMLRLFVGLVVLFGAFWLGFAGILINWRRPTRCFVIIPFAIGWYLVMSSLYNVDGVLAMLGWSESMHRPMPYLDKVEDPYLRQLMLKRGLFVLLITALVAAAFCVLFIFVPGHRL